MQMLCALFSFIKMIKQQWASWARTQQRNKQGPGQALLFVNTNIQIPDDFEKHAQILTFLGG